MIKCFCLQNNPHKYSNEEISLDEAKQDFFWEIFSIDYQNIVFEKRNWKI